MIIPEPSIIIIWTYQDMMEWMGRILVGEMAGADEDFGWEAGQIQLSFSDELTANPTQQNPRGPNDPPEPSIIIIWTYQDMMEWITSRILVGEMAGGWW
jgi:hypothetical protein